MTSFSSIWDSEVKKLAQASITEPKLVRLMLQPANYVPTQEEEEYLETVGDKCKDPYGMVFILAMMSEIEYYLAGGKEKLARDSAKEVYDELASPDYMSAFFEDDMSSDEAKTRIALRDGLKKLIECD